MIEKVIKLYQFNELSEKAKEAVKELNFWHIQLYYLINADTYIDLLERCYKNIIDDNIEAYNSNEFMEDFLNSNEYYFYENGGLWLGA